MAIIRTLPGRMMPKKRRKKTPGGVPTGSREKGIGTPRNPNPNPNALMP